MGTIPPAPSVAAVFQKLKTSAKELNVASDQLGQAISAVDDSLKKLNLGIVAWTEVSSSTSPSGAFATHSIGYDKINGKWGVGLRRTWGHEHAPEDYGGEDSWLFNDAPRDLRIESINSIPALLEELINQTDTTVSRIQDGVIYALEFAAEIESIAINASKKK